MGSHVVTHEDGGSRYLIPLIPRKAVLRLLHGWVAGLLVKRCSALVKNVPGAQIEQARLTVPLACVGSLRWNSFI